MDSISKILRTFTLAILSVTGCSMVLAQTNADKQYVQDLKSKLDILYKEYSNYDNNVKSLEQKKVKDIDMAQDTKNRERLNNLYDQEYNDSLTIKSCDREIEQKQKLISRKKGAVLDDEIEKFVIKLLNSPCNPKAIVSLERYEEFVSPNKLQTLGNHIDKLKLFPNYSENMLQVLLNFEEDLKLDLWKKQNEGSDILNQFDNELSHIRYLERYNKRGEKIPFLDECYNKILEMRSKGFENCQADYAKVIKDLKPNNNSFTSPFSTLINLYNDIENLKIKKEEAIAKINGITPEIKDLEIKIKNNEKTYNENKNIKNQRKQETEKLNAKKDAIDKVLYDACLYCLDQKHPCDTLGNNEWLRKEVEKLTDTKSKYPQSEDYKKLFSQFHELFNNYKAYTLEIGEFLQNCYKYNKGNGELTNAMRNEINTELKNLKYWKYYSNRNGKNAVHSRNLDYILGEFEAMFNTNFKNCKARYRKLGPMLRGVE